MSDGILAAAFLASAGLCAWVYAGYPVLVWARARIRPRPVRRAPVRPTVTVIVPAFNEQDVIEEKVRNTLAVRYPRDRMQVVVASDGSTDRTVEVASRHAGEGVETLALERRGKAHALNAAARAARGDVLVFTDATTLLEETALVNLVENFADPEVGGVCGNQVYLEDRGADATAAGEGTYWSYDTWVRSQESRGGNLFASDGSLHAVLRDLYVPLRVGSGESDDIAISARVVLQGRRLVFEPYALVFERPPRRGGEEFARRVRVTVNSVRALLGLGRGLWTHGFYSLQLLSHKLLRYVVPFCLLAVLVSSAALARRHPVFLAALALQLALYGAGLVGWGLRNTAAGRAAPLSLPYFFCLANLAALIGVIQCVRGRRMSRWTPRGGGEGP